MSDKITNLVHDLLAGIHGIAKSETIVGEPQQAGEAMIIPVHRLKVAFGVGSAKAGAQAAKAGAESGGMAAGGAIELDPVAAIAIGKDGMPRILTVDAEAEGTWSALLQEAPDLIARVVTALGDRVSGEVKARMLESGAAKTKALEAPEEKRASAPSADAKAPEPAAKSTA